MPTRNQICYVEFHASDLERTKAFFSTVFGWVFTDYGPDYCAFGSPDFGGGFARGTRRNRLEEGGAAVVIFSDELERVRDRVSAHGGTITRDIFSFPGGRRFHFTEPSGNELAVCDIEGV
ncbi:MAG TPA: VOC family protein [Opitutaceae bacterium]|nr:VOC family protein [Opitutaceae bacterium]